MFPVYEIRGTAYLIGDIATIGAPADPKNRKEQNRLRLIKKLLDKTELDTSYITTMSEEDSKACETLFQELYIEKYTNMNMKMTAQWFLLACNSGMFDYFIIRDGEHMKAFAMTYDDALGLNGGIYWL